MGVKGQSGQQKKPAAATSEQVRFAQLTLEGKSTEDDTANIQKLIKKVIETTRCSPAQAELALFDNDNDLIAAVDYILEQGMQVESWTEQKSKKDKKKEEEDKKFSTRGTPSFRGRGGFAERGGRGGRGGSVSARGGGNGGGGGAPSTAPRGPSGRGGRGGVSNVKPQPSRSQTDASPQKPVETDLTEETADWKSGPMEFKRTEVPVASAPSSSTYTPAPATAPSSSTPAGPISFAAVAAAAARRQQEKSQPPPPASAPAPEPVRVPSPAQEFPVDEPETSESLPAEESFVSEPSVANPPQEHENEPEPEEEPVSVVSVHNVQAASPQLQANVTWTSQLKSDLGIGVPMATEVSPVKPQFTTSAPIAGVEFATEASQSVLTDYSFGFVDAPIATAPVAAAPAPPVPEPVPQTSDLFANSRHSAATVAPIKQAPEMGHSNLSNGDYTLRNNSPPALQTSARSLGFGDAQSVSYAPTAAERQQQHQPVTKPLSHMPQPHQGAPSAPQHQSHQQQQAPQMFPQQLPYSSFPPYMGMYSPVTNVRPDDYAAMLGQYPFNAMNMDLANFITNSGLAPQSSSSTLSSQQHRSDSHGMDPMKFQSSQNTRDQSQASAVQPPPGFGTGASFMTQPLSNLVMQQHPYPPHQFPYYLPNVGNAGGRQMYAQDDDRKAYEKMTGGKAHATPPPQFHHSNANYLGGGGPNNKKYNWNP